MYHIDLNSDGETQMKLASVRCLEGDMLGFSRVNQFGLVMLSDSVQVKV